MRADFENRVMVVFKHLETNQILALNNPKGVYIHLNLIAATCELKSHLWPS